MSSAIVCGGRDFHAKRFVFGGLSRLAEKIQLENVISGGAKGVDTLAVRWAHAHSVRVKIFKADWKGIGKGAGPVRNKKMLDHLLTLPGDKYVIAFPGGDGTAGMVRIAKESGVKVLSLRCEWILTT